MVYAAAVRDREAYAAACGRLRSLEKRLLGRLDLEELLRADGWESIAAMLARRDYFPPEGAGRDGWETGLAEELRRSDNLLLRIDPDPEVTRILVLAGDLWNLRAALRARFLGRAFDAPRHPRGVHTPELIEEMARTFDFSPYPAPLAAELAGMTGLAATQRAADVNAAVTLAHHRALITAARRSGSRFLLDLLGHGTDLRNIVAFLRRRRSPASWPEPHPPLPGGHLTAAPFEAPGADPAAAAAGTVYAPLLERCRLGEGTYDLPRLEREADDFVTALWRPAKYVTLGPEPLWAYFFARETDAKNIRAVLLGRQAGFPADLTRETLRASYV